MSMINKLSIQGIRSFGDDRQKIEFSTPLTLIVGENGCGKTTIIECLKYALTGNVPPGSDKGRNFVHDVKLVNRNTSDGRVELTITDPSGNDKTVFRSMRLESSKGKVKFHTFDSTIKYSGEGDKFTSGRVEDVNNHMCEAMGVSKAIINNVIFCHQEDSNWPLDEGKKLKEKFDAIFGTTEYDKLVNKLLKIKKTYDDKAKYCKAEIKYLEEIKMQVEKKERNIVDLQGKVQNIMKQHEDFEARKAPLEIKLKQLIQNEMDFGALMIEESEYKSGISSKTQQRKNIEAKIKTKLSGTIKDLEKLKEDFVDIQKKKQADLKSLEDKNEELVANERKNHTNLNEYKNRAANCIDKIQKHQELKAERFDKVKEICSILQLGFDYNKDQSADTYDIRETLESVNEGISKREDNIKIIQKKSREDEETFQKKIDKLRDEKTKLETNLSSHRQSLKKFDDDFESNQIELNKSEKSIPILNQLKPKIDEFEKKLKKLNDENQVDDLREKQETLNVEVIELEDQLTELEKDIDILQKSSQITSQLELKETDLAKDQEEFERIKNKVSSNLKNLFSKQSIDANFRAKIQRKHNELEAAVKQHKEQLAKIERECDTIQIQRTNLRKQQTEKDQEIQRIKREASDLCRGSDYPDFLASQKDKVEKLNLEKAVKESSKNTYKDFIEKINISDTPCCPLCHTGLKKDGADKLKDELEENIRELPRKINNISAKLKEETRIYDKLVAFSSYWNSLDKLVKETSKLESDLKALNSKLNAKNEEKDNLEMIVAEPESLLSLITPSFIADASKLDDLQNGIMKRTKEIDELKAKLPSNIPKKSLNKVQSERKETVEKIKASNEKIKKTNEEINNFQAELMDTREKLNDLNTKKNQYQERVQGIEILKEQLKKIKNDKKDMKQKIIESESKLQPMNEELIKVNKEKQKVRINHQLTIDNEQTSLNKLKIDQSEIERLEKEIIGYEKMNLENSLSEFKRDVEKCKAIEKQHQEELSKITNEIKNLNDFLANDETTYRNIMDNIEYLKLGEEIKKIEINLQKLKEQIGDFDVNAIKDKKKKISTEIGKISSERAKLSGQEEVLNKQIGAVEEELNEEKYKTAKEKYKTVFCNEIVYSAMSSDLKKYTTALEKSLLKFHQEKMDQINQIMKELWNSIYQGNDIDSIMIKTDEEADGSATTEKSKRSYNYRVVQIKNGTEIDMRGRCSAGQKVLASLIIRIALADTFSSSCGILALDEPTTNLDHNNITSLSNALAQLVAERDNGRFMLIIITHDETFVRTLERAEKYYKLSRDCNGCSVIEEFNNY